MGRFGECLREGEEYGWDWFVKRRYYFESTMLAGHGK